MGRVVLVTRPEPGLGETMRAVAALGFEPIAAPLLRIEPLRPTIPRRVQAVLLTSGQAVAPLAGLAPWLLEVPVLAVGGATAARAREAGFAGVRSADGDANRLAALAAGTLRPDGLPLLLACGRGQGAELAARLRPAGFRLTRRCVYRTVAEAELAAEAIDALRLGAVAAVLFFSAETARTFCRALPDGLRGSLRSTSALAISERAASGLAMLDWERVAVAREPNAASLLALLGDGTGKTALRMEAVEPRVDRPRS